MKRYIACFCAILLAITCVASAFASNFYIIPDSNTRLLTREELWTWQYDALGFILNEIFARHGFHFKTGEKFDVYFRSQSWYRENTVYDNQGIYKNLVTNIEWANEQLIKEVRAEMRTLGTRNESGKALPTATSEKSTSSSFSHISTVKNGRLDSHPNYTVGEAFDAFFADVVWRVVNGTDGNIYVNVTGGFYHNNKPAQALIKFRLLDGGRFQLAGYERNGKGQSWNALSALIASIFNEYENTLANEENVDDGWYESMGY